MAAVIQMNRQRLIYVHDADLTLDGRVADPAIGFDSVDVTTFNDSARRNNPGLQANSFAYSGLYEDATARSYRTLRDMVGTSGTGGTSRTVSVFFEGDGTSKEGYGLSAANVVSMTFEGGPGEAEAVSGDFQQDGTYSQIISLGAKSTITADALTGTYDRGVTASSSNGGVMFVHVFGNAAAGANTDWIIRLQEATTATGAYSDVASLTVGSGTTLGTAIVFTGDFDRFVRGSFDEDSTTGTLSFQLSFVAN